MGNLPPRAEPSKPARRKHQHRSMSELPRLCSGMSYFGPVLVLALHFWLRTRLLRTCNQLQLSAANSFALNWLKFAPSRCTTFYGQGGARMERRRSLSYSHSRWYAKPESIYGPHLPRAKLPDRKYAVNVRSFSRCTQHRDCTKTSLQSLSGEDSTVWLPNHWTNRGCMRS